MNVQSYLNNIREERITINAFADRVEELRAAMLPSAIRYDKINVMTSPDADPMLDALEEIHALEQDIRLRLVRLIPEYNKARDAIAELPDLNQRKVLHLYYLDSRVLPMSSIAIMLGYTERNIYEIRRKALQNIVFRY